MFSDNSAFSGGGMQNRHSSLTVGSCTFSSNYAFSGGGMFSFDCSSFTVTDCTFSDNDTYSNGGGMTNSSSAPTVTSCTFSGNYSGNFGGGMHNLNSASTVSNCTFSNNSADNFGGGMNNRNSAPTVTSCILWNDTAPDGPEIYDDNSTPIVTYSDIEGGYTGNGNIDADPLFVDPDEGDLHLSTGSPCIDAANGPEAPELDLDGNPRVDDPDSPNTGVGPPWADMGAYEYQPPG